MLVFYKHSFKEICTLPFQQMKVWAISCSVEKCWADWERGVAKCLAGSWQGEEVLTLVNCPPFPPWLPPGWGFQHGTDYMEIQLLCWSAKPLINPLTLDIGQYCPSEVWRLITKQENVEKIVKINYSTKIATATFFNVMSIPFNSKISKL